MERRTRSFHAIQRPIQSAMRGDVLPNDVSELLLCKREMNTTAERARAQEGGENEGVTKERERGERERKREKERQEDCSQREREIERLTDRARGREEREGERERR